MQPTGIQLVITLTPEGQVQVAGPLNDRVLCYGLLESARDAIREYRPPSPVEVPTPGVARRLLGG